MLNFEDIKTLWIKLFFSAKLLSHFSRVRLCATPQTTAHQAPRPWDSPGKNTGVGCHFLLQCMKVKSQSEAAQSCLTPSDHMECSLPGSSAHGICQARVLEWGAIAFLWYPALADFIVFHFYQHVNKQNTLSVSVYCESPICRRLKRYE